MLDAICVHAGIGKALLSISISFHPLVHQSPDQCSRKQAKKGIRGHTLTIPVDLRAFEVEVIVWYVVR